MPDALLTHCSEHVPDALHERTDGRTNAESSVQPRDESAPVSDVGARVAPEFPTQVYLVAWPDQSFIKVGCSRDGRRWRSFLRRGGVLLLLLETTERRAYDIEHDLIVTLACAGFKGAFANQSEAAPFLGAVGRGWSECFRVAEDQCEKAAGLLTSRLRGMSSEELHAYLQQVDELAARRKGA